MPERYPLRLKAAICIAVALFSITLGCRRKPPTAAAPPPPPPVAAEPEPQPIIELPPADPAIVAPVVPVIQPGAIAFETADRAYAVRDYATATRNFEEYLRIAPAGERREDALFHLGLIYALPENQTRDWAKSLAYLKQLTTEFPSSPHRASAELILTLRNEVTQLNSDAEKQNQRIRQLTTELDRLKQIDAERRRRP